jgi:hypothetical protein
LTVLQFLTENNMAAVSYHFFRRKRPLWFLPLLKDETPDTETKIRGYLRDWPWIAGVNGQHQETGIPEIFGAVGEALSPVYALGRGQYRLVKVKVKLTLEQAMKAQRGSRGIALLFP